jgi:hypothetical protein
LYIYSDLMNNMKDCCVLMLINVTNQQAQWLEAKYKLTAYNALCSLNDGDGEYETSNKIFFCKHKFIFCFQSLSLLIS